MEKIKPANKKSKWRRCLKWLFIICTILLLLTIISGYITYYYYFKVPPKTRLALGAYYPEMPPSKRNHYLELLIDNTDPAKGKYMGFYRLSPHFKKDQNTIFFLTDGQQPLFGPDTDDEFFESKLKGLSYVLIGRRGHSPTLFPEVYNSDASLKHKEAMHLLGSWQHVEDIEKVRQDLIKKSLLARNEKIMLYGGSGGGFLVQQYLAKYGKHVSRALMESSIAFDVARAKQMKATCNFVEEMKKYDSNVLKQLKQIIEQKKVDRLCLMRILQRIPYNFENGTEIQSKIIKEIHNDNFTLYKKFLWKPAYNFYIIKYFFKLPDTAAGKVRIFEFLNKDLKNYQPDPANPDLLMDWMGELLKDFSCQVALGKLQIPQFDLTQKRKEFKGEVLVLSGKKDHTALAKVAKEMSHYYPNSKYALFDDTHRLPRYPKYYRAIRKSFLTEGFTSEKFQKHYQDTRQLNR